MSPLDVGRAHLEDRRETTKVPIQLAYGSKNQFQEKGEVVRVLQVEYKRSIVAIPSG